MTSDWLLTLTLSALGYYTVLFGYSVGFRIATKDWRFSRVCVVGTLVLLVTSLVTRATEIVSLVGWFQNVDLWALLMISPFITMPVIAIFAVRRTGRRLTQALLSALVFVGIFAAGKAFMDLRKKENYETYSFGSMSYYPLPELLPLPHQST